MKKLFIFLFLLSSVNFVGCDKQNKSIMVVRSSEALNVKNDSLARYMLIDVGNNNTSSFNLELIDKRNKFNVGDTIKINK